MSKSATIKHQEADPLVRARIAESIALLSIPHWPSAIDGCAALLRFQLLHSREVNGTRAMSLRASPCAVKTKPIFLLSDPRIRNEPLPRPPDVLSQGQG